VTVTRRLLVRQLTVDLSPLRSGPHYRRLWSGDGLATFGRSIMQVAIPVQVYGLTHSSLVVGLVSLTQLFPLIAGSLLGGVVADASDRRRILMATQATLAILGIGLAVNASVPDPQLWVIFVLAVAQAVASGFDSPARRAAMPALVGLDLLPSALALQQLLGNTLKLVGPAIAGVLIAAFGLPVTYWVYVATFVAGLLTVTGLPSIVPGSGGRKAGWSSLREGLAYVANQRLVRSIFLVDLNAMVFGLPRALFPAIGTTVLGGTAATVGLLYAAPGAGALLCAATSGWVGRVERQGRAVLAVVGIWGLAMIGFGLSRSVPVAIAFLMLGGAADMVSAVLRTTMVQLSTPDQLRGRVASVNKAVVSGGPLIGDAEAGAVAELTSTTFSVVSGGVLSIVGMLLIWWRYPDFSRVTVGNGTITIAGKPDGTDDGAARGP
jgi:MFS family permease